MYFRLGDQRLKFSWLTMHYKSSAIAEKTRHASAHTVVMMTEQNSRSALIPISVIPALRPVAAPQPPAPGSAPARPYSVTPAHRSAPAHPVFGPLRLDFRSTCAPLSVVVIQFTNEWVFSIRVRNLELIWFDIQTFVNKSLDKKIRPIPRTARDHNSNIWCDIGHIFHSPVAIFVRRNAHNKNVVANQGAIHMSFSFLPLYRQLDELDSLTHQLHYVHYFFDNVRTVRTRIYSGRWRTVTTVAPSDGQLTQRLYSCIIGK